MKPADREAWIADYLQGGSGVAPGSLDVLNRDFVDDYIRVTGAAFREVMYGAHKCPQLGRDLSRMAAKNALRRFRTGIEGMAGLGFPRWVWSYRL